MLALTMIYFVSVFFCFLLRVEKVLICVPFSLKLAIKRFNDTWHYPEKICTGQGN